MTKYIFENLLVMPFQICKRICKILICLMFIYEKNVQISFDELYANNLKIFLCKTCAICFLMS